MTLSHPMPSMKVFPKPYLTLQQYEEISNKLNEMVRDKCLNSPIIESQLSMIDYLVSNIKHVHSKFRIFPKKKLNKFSNFSIFYNYLKRYPKIDEDLLIGNPPLPLVKSINSDSFPIGCKYLLFDRLVFKDALHYFSSIIFNKSNQQATEKDYLKVFDNSINSVDVSKHCVSSGGRTEFVDVYNEISKYFPQRNVIGQLIVLNRDKSEVFRNEISSLANYWMEAKEKPIQESTTSHYQYELKQPEITTTESDSFEIIGDGIGGVGGVGDGVDEKTLDTSLNQSLPTPPTKTTRISPTVTVTTTTNTRTSTDGLPLKTASSQPISMMGETNNGVNEWFLGIPMVKQSKTLFNFLRDAYLMSVYKTRNFVIWLVNIVDFSQTQLKEENPYMLDNPYVSIISHAIVSTGLTMLTLMVIPYANSFSFGIFLISALCFETLSFYYMFLDNADRTEVEQTHVVRGEKLWLFYQLLNFLYIPLISVIFSKNRNAAFIPAATCFVLSNLYMYNSVAMFDFFSRLATILFTLAILRSINFGEFIVRDLVETVQQDLEIDKGSFLSNNREAFEIVKQHNESREAPTKIFIDERPADYQNSKPASTYDVFIHEFSHIPIKPAVNSFMDTLLSPVDDLDISEMTKEMPSSPCPTYTEDIRE